MPDPKDGAPADPSAPPDPPAPAFDGLFAPHDLAPPPSDDDGPIDAWIGIRQHGRSESLNVAMASTVLAFEVARRT